MKTETRDFFISWFQVFRDFVIRVRCPSGARTAFCLVVCLWAASPSLAQAQARPPTGGRSSSPPPAPSEYIAESPVRFGLKGGISIAQLMGDDTGGWDTRTGFAGGGFVNVRLSDVVSLQPELLYVMKGSAHEEDLNGETLRVSLAMDYLEIPLLFKVTIPTEIPIQPAFLIGPSVDIKVKGTQRAEYEGQSTEQDIDDLKGVDAGIMVGGGLEFDTGYGVASCEIRYEWGLTKIFGEGNVHSGALLIMAGYLF